jgi:membrane-bound ClpP family serine protease
VAGRVWHAVAAGTLPRGATVRVVGNDGELLRVEAAYPAAAPPAVPAAPAQSHPVPPSA